MGPVVRRSTATYKPRRRRVSESRRHDLQRWLLERGIDPEGPPLTWRDVFQRDGDVVIDIGFGHGESTLALARARPELDVVGVEVHTPGVATALEAIDDEGLDNVRIVHGDALDLFGRVRSDSLYGVTIYFPDPWPKARQHHRRLVLEDFVGAVTDRLRVGGFVALATDVDDYAAVMEDACEAETRLYGGPVDRPDIRPMTRFEHRAIAAGRTITDLRYERTS